MPLYTFIKPFADAPKFCFWELRESHRADGTVREAKTPMDVTRGRPTSVSSGDGFGTYREAVKALATACRKLSTRAFEGGIGIHLHFWPRLVCVDLDHVRPEGRLMPAWRKLIDASNTFAEISVSGEGVHLYFWLDKPHSFVVGSHPDARGGKIEICCQTPRFIALGRPMPGTPSEPRTITLTELCTMFPKLAEKLAPKRVAQPPMRPTIKSNASAAAIERSCRVIAAPIYRTGRCSNAFFGQVLEMDKRCANAEQMLAAFEAAPRGAACERYLDEGRLEQQIDACLANL